MAKKSVKLEKIIFFIIMAEVSKKIKTVTVTKKVSEKHFRIYQIKKVL